MCSLILSHNFNAGELELTFLQTFCRGANLKALFYTEGLSAAFDALKPAFLQYFGVESRGSLVNDLLALAEDNDELTEWVDGAREEELSTELAESLLIRLNKDSGRDHTVFKSTDDHGDGYILDRTIQYRSMLKVNGVMFATAEKSKGNSLILFQGADKKHHAAQIRNIFVHSRPTAEGVVKMESFVVVQEFLDLAENEIECDLYRRFPLLDVRLYRQQLSPEAVVIKVTDIISHFASCPYETGGRKDFQVVLSLDRASHRFQPNPLNRCSSFQTETASLMGQISTKAQGSCSNPWFQDNGLHRGPS